MLDNRKDRPLRQALMDQLRRILRKKQFPPEGDPYSYVGATLRCRRDRRRLVPELSSAQLKRKQIEGVVLSS